jgi:hypothetical protein
MNPHIRQSRSRPNPCPGFSDIDQMVFPVSTWEHVRVAEYAWEPLQQGHHRLWQGEVRGKSSLRMRNTPNTLLKVYSSLRFSVGHSRNA